MRFCGKWLRLASAMCWQTGFCGLLAHGSDWQVRTRPGSLSNNGLHTRMRRCSIKPRSAAGRRGLFPADRAIDFSATRSKASFNERFLAGRSLGHLRAGVSLFACNISSDTLAEEIDPAVAQHQMPSNTITACPRTLAGTGRCSPGTQRPGTALSARARPGWPAAHCGHRVDARRSGPARRWCTGRRRGHRSRPPPPAGVAPARTGRPASAPAEWQ